MLATFFDVRHMYLSSGPRLPRHLAEEMVAYLDSHPRTDFIESVTTEDVGWTIGGLNLERFTLRFPFSWRKLRYGFDWYVNFQPRMKFRRKVPPVLVPHLGSQWWCLTRQTLSAILESPDREEIDRYFKRVWIPDESYFQTMVRQFSTDVASQSLTLSKFDDQGKPHIFFDDHFQLLRRSDCFVACQIWLQAEQLCDTFLRAHTAVQAAGEPNPGKIDRLFTEAVERRMKGRAGLYMKAVCRMRIGRMGEPPRPILCLKASPKCLRILKPGLARLRAPAPMAICLRRTGWSLPGKRRFSAARCRTRLPCATMPQRISCQT